VLVKSTNEQINILIYCITIIFDELFKIKGVILGSTCRAEGLNN
jgi:hypothetical protein